MAQATAVSYGEGDYISDGRRLLRIIEWAHTDGETAEALVEDVATNVVRSEVLNPAMWIKITPEVPEDG